MLIFRMFPGGNGCPAATAAATTSHGCSTAGGSCASWGSVSTKTYACQVAATAYVIKREGESKGREKGYHTNNQQIASLLPVNRAVVFG